MSKIMFFATGLLFALASISCQKDDYSPSAKRLLPSKISSLADQYLYPNISIIEQTWEFEYDSENRISSMTFKQNSHPDYYVHMFTYDGDNITQSVINYYEPLFSGEIYYTREGMEIRIVDRFKRQNNIVIDSKLRSTNNAYDAKGNMKYSGDKSLRYDKENGIFRHVNMPSWYLTEILNCDLALRNLYNNCIETLKDKSGFGFEMTYNTDNYPTEIHRFPIEMLGDGKVSYEIEYIEAN